MLINMASVTYVLCVVEPMCSQAVQAQTLLDTLLFGRSQMDRADFWYGASDRPWGQHRSGVWISQNWESFSGRKFIHYNEL